MIPFAKGEALARSIEDARFVPLESNNHILLEKEPAFRMLVNEMKEFLGENSSSPPLSGREELVG